ncbi:DUF2631 domain-containing protein [uncultured Corynebacterium sp.]|uniref:DUF2631 domain-containing protein n=1 Tax=uncultured Corynebacterium sp. TaxID=159447 RepID=UPI0025D3D322|nr:DUF2631 domain-containing protein [uncultured Corynebacterium sp.]
MSNGHQKEEVHNGVSTLDVPNAKWGWSGLSEATLQKAGWIGVIFLLAMLFGNHPGKVENIWLIGLAVIFAIALLWRAFSPRGKQVRTVTARNKRLGHVEPNWADDQVNGNGAYAELNERQMRAWNREPGGKGQTPVTGGIPGPDEDKDRTLRA